MIGAMESFEIINEHEWKLDSQDIMEEDVNKIMQRSIKDKKEYERRIAILQQEKGFLEKREKEALAREQVRRPGNV